MTDTVNAGTIIQISHEAHPELPLAAGNRAVVIKQVGAFVIVRLLTSGEVRGVIVDHVESESYIPASRD